MSLKYDEQIEELRQFAEYRRLSRDITQYEAKMIGDVVAILATFNSHMMNRDVEHDRLARDNDWLQGQNRRLKAENFSLRRRLTGLITLRRCRDIRRIGGNSKKEAKVEQNCRECRRSRRS